MRNVTPVLEHYRKSVRAIWWQCFEVDPELKNWESYSTFMTVKRLLFDAMVLTKLDEDWDVANLFNEPIPMLHVVPRTASGVPILISREQGGIGGRWDHPVERVGPGEVTLQFIKFFDWDQLGHVDFQYYRTKIAEFQAHPELVGHEALLEVMYADVFFEPSEPETGESSIGKL